MAADANVAEMATLFATMLTLLVGMGTIKVQDESGNVLRDPTRQQQKLSEAERGAFYVIICELFALPMRVSNVAAAASFRLGSACRRGIRCDNGSVLHHDHGDHRSENWWRSIAGAAWQSATIPAEVP